MSEMSIGEVAARTGIPASTLRYYEQIGLLPVPRRENGQRRYGPEVLRLLALIQVAKQASFSLTEIRNLLETESPVAEGWRAIAAAENGRSRCHDRTRQSDQGHARRGHGLHLHRSRKLRSGCRILSGGWATNSRAALLLTSPPGPRTRSAKCADSCRERRGTLPASLERRSSAT